MKWVNKGHEFDELGEVFKRNKDLVLVGSNFGQGYSWAKNDLRDLLDFLKPEVDVRAYEFPVFLENTVLMQNIVDLSQKSGGLMRKVIKKFSKVKRPVPIMQNRFNMFMHETELDVPGKTVVVNYLDLAIEDKVINMLEKTGLYTRNMNLFVARDFINKYLSIFAVYVADKVYIWHSNMVMTTVCNLNCKYCLNFQPFVKHPRHRDLNDMKNDIDILCDKVSGIGYFQLTGGESLLYPYVKDLIKHIKINHKQKIKQVLFATNGTQIPDDELCEILKSYDIHVIVDNYILAVPTISDSLNTLIDKLKKYEISYTLQPKESPFITLFPTNQATLSLNEEQLIARAPKCNDGYIMFQENRNGRLYYCNYHSFANTAGIIGEDADDYFDLKTMREDQKKELVEFRLGYSNKGFTSFCRYCNGQFGPNDLPRRMAGEQIKGHFKWDKDNPTHVEGFTNA